MSEKHTLNKGMGYNYLGSAAHLYWAARVIEMRPSLDEKDKMLDDLIIRRLRKLANDQLCQGIQYLERELTDAEKEALLIQTVAPEIKND